MESRMNLWATKSIATLRAEADQAGEHQLKRALTPLNLITLGIGAIIGAGIFVLTGQAAAQYAGPAVWISMILVGIACAFAGLCYAEMASAVPVAGSAYTYSYATMGELVAWIIGWDLVLEYAAGAATVGVGWSGHFVSLLGNFGLKLPAGQEARNPQKDMPIGILGSLFVCTLLYVIVSALLTGMVNYKELLALQTSSPPDYAAPMAYAMKHVGAPEWVRISVDVGAVLGLGSVILVMLLGQSRVFYSMSRDGLLGGWAGRVHPKFRTPYLSTIYTGIAVGLATGLLPLQLLGQLVNIGTLLAFVLVCAGVWILRKKRPDLDRPDRTPWVPFVPIAGVVCCLGLMATLPADTWIRLIVWLLIGFVIYFSYSRKHSRLQRELAAGAAGGRPAAPGMGGGGMRGQPPR